MVYRDNGCGASDGREDSAERERRRRDFDAAISSIALEGLSVPDAYEREAERFIRGEIDFDTLTSKVHELALIR